MKKVLSLVLAFFVCSIFSIAEANLINNPGFESFTGTFTNSNFLSGNNSTWGIWLDRQVWKSVDGSASGAPAGWGGNNFALQGPTDNTTDLLMQGWDGALTPAGTKIAIQFDHLYTAGYNPKFQVYGFATTTGIWKYEAPFGPTDGTSLLNITNVGISTAGWLHKSYEVTIPNNYVAIAIGFIYGGDDVPNITGPGPGFRGIDNVNVSAVPEPTTMLLLGFGLIGLASVRRKI